MAVQRYDIPNQARFLTFSCFRRVPLFESPEARDAFVEHIELQRARVAFEMIAYVVMKEHVHMVVLPSGGELGPVMRGVKQGFARDTLARWREREAPVLERLLDSDGITRFWQRGGGYDRNVRDLDELREKVNYIHQNPVKSGFAERAEDWAWSSARDYLGDPGVVEIRKDW